MRRGIAAVLALAAMIGLQPLTVRAEVAVLNIAHGFSIAYLPLMIIDRNDLFQRHARAAGLGDVAITRFQSAANITATEALLSGSVHFAAAGTPSTILLWDRTKGRDQVKGVGATSNMPMILNTRDPNVKTIRDFSAKNRIALPGVGTSIMALVLQIAAEQEFGVGKHKALDQWTVTRGIADGSLALLSGKGEIDSHFGSADFALRELDHPGIHTVLHSEKVLAGPASYASIFTTSSFREKNPKTYQAFVAAVDEAMDILNKDKRAAALTFIEITRSNQSVESILKLIEAPGFSFTRAPQGMMKFAEFMHRTGVIKNKPDDWKEMFFPEAHAGGGN